MDGLHLDPAARRVLGKGIAEVVEEILG